MDKKRPRTRIQMKNTAAIMEAALDIFSQHGFRGATLDLIAKSSGLSKPNLLYYFPSKEAIHIELLSGLMETWIAPLRALDPQGDPITELMSYVDRKLQMSQDYPRESRLFANEIVQGAPRMFISISEDLKALVDEKSAILQTWSDDGKIAKVNPRHLLFSIWALTQHYADFDVQIRAILDGHEEDPFEEARHFVHTAFLRIITP
ncbi:TetR family transcriptional regulator C-terminal domain-containing protein [Cochlodiniinecator piscidefendens]|uniref:TetR family transcriptional regulator C-terminal domain-containing protein n=1 Tax=Cochlodiniinecator piscidefendens TaxID=2715756 RepID=UPI0014081D1F|nr:TetR family transcriptional regulator C-terminal domain-containing protein [Cochlodiniinecator piscidefendens]